MIAVLLLWRRVFRPWRRIRELEAALELEKARVKFEQLHSTELLKILNTARKQLGSIT